MIANSCFRYFSEWYASWSLVPMHTYCMQAQEEEEEEDDKEYNHSNKCSRYYNGNHV